MFDLISTLMRGANARAVEAATDHFAIDLITQKIREAEAGVGHAKTALAALIVRQRQEQSSLAQLKSRQASLEERVRLALQNGDEALAADGAAAVADIENEAAVRTTTLGSLNERVARLRKSVEQAHRRVADLRQSAIAAQAIDLERRAQRKINRTLSSSNAMHEAERLIQRVTEQDDPLDHAEALDEVERSLTHRTTEERLAAAGHGPAMRTSAEDVLARLRTKA